MVLDLCYAITSFFINQINRILTQCRWIINLSLWRLVPNILRLGSMGNVIAKSKHLQCVKVNIENFLIGCLLKTLWSPKLTSSITFGTPCRNSWGDTSLKSLNMPQEITPCSLDLFAGVYKTALCQNIRGLISMYLYLWMSKQNCKQNTGILLRNMKLFTTPNNKKLRKIIFVELELNSYIWILSFHCTF